MNFSGNDKIAEILMKNGADLNIRCEIDMNTAIAIAAQNGM